METTPQNQERIERYLQRRLSPAEQADLEADCAADPVLAEALAHERDVMQLARASRMLELQETLQAHASAQRNRPRIRRMLMAFAAAAVIFLAVYIGFLRPPQYAREGEQLIQELVSDRGERGDDPIAPIHAKGLKEKAIDCLSQGQPRLALVYLSYLGNGDDSLAHEAHYYSALAYTQLHDPIQTRKELNSYLELNGIAYGQKARELLALLPK